MSYVADPVTDLGGGGEGGVIGGHDFQILENKKEIYKKSSVNFN